MPRAFHRPLTGLVAAMTTLALLTTSAAAFDTRARAAYVVDLRTGTVLLDKNADMPTPPASMSKLMTLYIAFEAIRDGRLSLNEKLPVSEHAMSYGGSTMFLNTQDQVRVEDLLRGIIVLSGNDACVVLAEALSPDGTEAGFARYMTQRAQQMGMTNSTFQNANGWPQAGHVMSMRDLVLLTRHIMTDFPEYYPLFSERQFTFDGRAPANVNNRNPLLGVVDGADGLKTGHTQEAGYGLVGSVTEGTPGQISREDRRIVFAFSGTESTTVRAEEARAISNWAFRQFVEKDIVKAGDEVIRAQVWNGSRSSVSLTVAEDLHTLVPALQAGEMTANVVYTGPLTAPIAEGEQVGELILAPDGLPETRVPLVAATAVARGGFQQRVKSAALHLVRRLNEGPEGEAPVAEPASAEAGS